MVSNFFEELKNRNVYKVAVAYLVSSWLIIQVVDTIGPNLNWSDTVGPLIIKLLIVGFPIALVLTWLYEFTPKGLKLTGKVQENTEDNRRTGKRLSRLAIVVLSLALIFLLIEKFFLAGPVLYSEQQTASIGVLPFANFSSNPEHEYFADGLADQLLDELAGISGMLVPARTSSFAFKGKNQDIRKIAEQLQVNYILEGSTSYDPSQNRIRVIVQLINAANGYHLWSNTYEALFDSIFDIQEDISRKVARELQVRLLPEEDKALASQITENTEAYKLYLKSREFSQQRNDEDLDKGIDLLKKALELDPNFAEAHAELVFVYTLKHFYGSLSKEDRDESSKYHLDMALQLDGDKPEVLRAKAHKNIQARRDSSRAIADLRKAIELKPNYADAYYMLYQAFGWADQQELRLKYLEKAFELDPLNEFYATQLSTVYTYFGKSVESIQILDRLIARDSSAVAMRSKAVKIAQNPYGDLVQGFILIHEARKSDPYELFNLGFYSIYSLGLDLWPVSEKYFRILQNQYPDNETWTYNSLPDLYIYKKEYSKWKEWIDLWAAQKGLDKEQVARDLAGYYFAIGEYDMALRTFEQGIPGIRLNLLPDKSSLDYAQINDWVFYTDLLRLNQKQNEADLVADHIYKSVLLAIEQSSSLKLSADRYDLLLDCYYITNDLDNFVKTLEEQYYESKDRLGVFLKMKTGYYSRFEKELKYQEIEGRIAEDTRRMRSEVITFLKEEGEWDPAWDKELGLD